MAMNKRIALFFMLAAAMLPFPARVRAQSLPAYVRVGLTSVFNNSGEIRIGSRTFSFGYGDGNMGAFVKAAEITGNFSAVPTDMHYVKIEEYFYDYNSGGFRQ